MEDSDRLARMRQLAYESSDELIEEKGVVGVLLYGSTVPGKIHERNDVDIVVVYESHDDWYRLKEEKVVNGLKVDIPRIKHGNRQTLEILINEETFYYLRSF